MTQEFKHRLQTERKSVFDQLYEQRLDNDHSLPHYHDPAREEAWKEMYRLIGRMVFEREDTYAAKYQDPKMLMEHAAAALVQRGLTDKHSAETICQSIAIHAIAAIDNLPKALEHQDSHEKPARQSDKHGILRDPKGRFATALPVLSPVGRIMANALHGADVAWRSQVRDKYLLDWIKQRISEKFDFGEERYQLASQLHYVQELKNIPRQDFVTFTELMTVLNRDVCEAYPDLPLVYEEPITPDRITKVERLIAAMTGDVLFSCFEEQLLSELGIVHLLEQVSPIHSTIRQPLQKHSEAMDTNLAWWGAVYPFLGEFEKICAHEMKYPSTAQESCRRVHDVANIIAETMEEYNHVTLDQLRAR